MMPEIETDRKRVLDLGRGFLKAFAQAVKLLSLYQLGHPVPTSQVQEAWQELHGLFTDTGWPSVTLSLSAGRWLLNESILSDSAQTYEILSMAFRSHAIQSLGFKPRVRLYEFSALCDMASTPPNRAYQTDAADFLKERGVENIEVNMEEFVSRRKVRPPASPVIQSPIALARRQAAPRPQPGASEPSSQGFGSFIKSLVEAAIRDPQERAQVYSEAVSLVQQALARHVAEATHRLLLEKQGILNERMRAEHVLSRVAEGKVIVDQEGRVLMMDPAAEQIAGKALSDMAGKPILESVEAGERAVALAKDLVIPENKPVSDEVRTAGAEEALGAFRQSMALVHDEQGRLVGTYAVLPYVAKFREAMKLQEDFIANVTHDLKAPLASIYAALEMIGEKLSPQLGQEEATLLEICVRNSRLLRQMIDELLDFSKIQSGRMTIRPAPIRPEEPVREAVEALRPWAASKGLALEIEGNPEGLPNVMADAGRLVQVLTNLISNAIKFTPKGGRITVRAAQGVGGDASCAVFSVTDTGCGIAAADQKRLFEKFSQITGDGRRREGVGLGLAIVKDLVHLHKGRVWVESEAGKGSIFSFAIPAAAQPGPLG